jgi:hypothetical protein
LSVRLESQDWSGGLLLAIAAGFLTVFLFGWDARLARLAASALLSGACLFIGIFVGFLFGIPRALQEDAAGLAPQPRIAGAQDDAAKEAIRVRYKANTNLEQISDWLTKILVGVGLTQLNRLPDLLDRAGLYFGAAVGGEIGPKVAVSIVLFFSISGFLFGYLWTRLLLGRALAEADIGAVAEKLESIVQAKQKQEEIDARALSLANRLLSGENLANFSFDELRESIQKATAPVRVLLFFNAREARRQAQSKGSGHTERAIPILQALIASDAERRFHRNYGQLGYALQEKSPPDHAAAEAAFSTAIQVRGPAKEHGYEGYELHRAIAKIMQDPNFKAGQPTVGAKRAEILADLDVALAGNIDIPDHEQLKDWISLNAPGHLARTGGGRDGQPRD